MYKNFELFSNSFLACTFAYVSPQIILEKKSSYLDENMTNILRKDLFWITGKCVLGVAKDHSLKEKYHFVVDQRT